MACFSASTLEVCPTPDAKSCPSFAKIIVFDLVCLQIFKANSNAFNSDSVGAFSVTVLKSAIFSVNKSLSCSKTPFNNVLNIIFETWISLRFNKMRFFLDFNTTKASSVKSGAINISKNKEFISSADALSTVPLVAKTPPKAEIVSQAKAFL